MMMEIVFNLLTILFISGVVVFVADLFE